MKCLVTKLGEVIDNPNLPKQVKHVGNIQLDSNTTATTKTILSNVGIKAGDKIYFCLETTGSFYYRVIVGHDNTTVSSTRYIDVDPAESGKFYEAVANTDATDIYFSAFNKQGGDTSTITITMFIEK